MTAPRGRSVPEVSRPYPPSQCGPPLGTACFLCLQMHLSASPHWLFILLPKLLHFQKLIPSFFSLHRSTTEPSAWRTHVLTVCGVGSSMADEGPPLCPEGRRRMACTFLATGAPRPWLAFSRQPRERRWLPAQPCR